MNSRSFLMPEIKFRSLLSALIVHYEVSDPAFGNANGLTVLPANVNDGLCGGEQTGDAPSMAGYLGDLPIGKGDINSAVARGQHAVHVVQLQISLNQGSFHDPVGCPPVLGTSRHHCRR